MINCLWLGFACWEYLWIFGIAELLTVIWLFFAWYQFIWPTEKFRLFNKWLTNRHILFFISISILFSLSWVIVNYMPGEALPFIWYSDFWQLLSLFIVITIGIIFAIKAILPFRKISDTKRFLDVLVIFLWKWWKYTVAIWGEIRYLIQQIVKLSDEGNQDAHNILRLTMDKWLIDNIIHEQFFTIIQILEVYINRNKIGDRYIDNLQEEFISTVIEKSLNSGDSIISKELRGELYAWINQGKWIISQRIFEQFEFINRYNLLSSKRFAWSYKYTEEKTKDYAINYSKFWKLAVNSFFRQERNDKWEITKKHIITNIVFYDDLYKWLLWFCWYKWIIINNYRDADLRISILGDIIDNISHHLRDNAKEILENYGNKIPIFKVDNMIWINNKNPWNFFEAIALGSYQLLETISHIKETEENAREIRDLTREVVIDTFWWDDDINKVSCLIKERLNYLILKQISENNIRGYYPNMTRNFFHIYGRRIFTNKINDEDKTFCLEVLKLLEANLPKLNSWVFWWITKKDDEIDEDLQEARKEKAQKIIWDILPYWVIYNQEKNTLTYYFGDKLDKAILDLSEVKNDKIVILNHKEETNANL